MPSLTLLSGFCFVKIFEMADILSLFKDYLNYLEIERGRSIKTCQNYERYLKVFLNFGKIKNEKEITSEIVREFRLWLARQEIKKNTQSYYIIALRNFLKYLIKRDIEVLPPDKIELPKIPTRQIETIEYEDLERLLSAAEGSDLRSLRDRAILEIFFSTGLRVSELCALNRYFDIKRGEIAVRGKGGKLRVVFLSERAKKALQNYLAKRTDAEEALFVSLTKSPKAISRIIPRTVQRLVDYYARKAGLPNKIHPHLLRHAFATDLLIGGADLRSVQELLGHANVSTTQIYTHLTNKQLREVHQAFHNRRRK